METVVRRLQSEGDRVVRSLVEGWEEERRVGRLVGDKEVMRVTAPSLMSNTDFGDQAIRISLSRNPCSSSAADICPLGAVISSSTKPRLSAQRGFVTPLVVCRDAAESTR